MSTRITVLGAGFGGMELSTILSESLGDKVQVTLIDKSDAFIFGFSKLDLMFGHTTLDAVRLPYRNFVKPGVRILRETVTAIDPTTRRVTTDAGVHDCDYLVVALGADYDVAATPGLEGANEFYSVAGANLLREILPGFSERGRAGVFRPAIADRCRSRAFGRGAAIPCIGSHDRRAAIAYHVYIADGRDPNSGHLRTRHA